MAKQPYIYYLMVLGGVGWDKNELIESNLHVHHTKIVVYKIGKWPKKGGLEKIKKSS